ncbi:hypothetical protein CRE_16323 [Caenorhabditis remanei]|uniref:F-box domain-containing protein n=1 Tax=Caenorhabditis remanei TaxID=31234 RepID=E3N806_CAERE|nr:hypothetical protein CRE_16323 [Caenorhabditis remanei]
MSEPDPVFKLRKLPFVALRKVFQYLEPVELLQFSMVSAAYRRTIISLRSHCLNNGYIGINNSSRMFHFEIWPKLGGPFRDFGHLKFREFEYPKLKKMKQEASEIEKIVLYGDDYVTGVMILSMKAHEIDISDCLVTTEDIMAFITRDWTTMECEIGYDIKRADGLVGSVLQDERQFEFFVWHKKFIDKKRL